MAIQRDINLTVYTGTFGIVTLADINNVQQPIYLAFDNSTGNGLIPAPLYYWKVVHDPVANTATAIVGINNPWLNPVPPEAVFCPSVCSQVPSTDQHCKRVINPLTFSYLCIDLLLIAILFNRAGTLSAVLLLI